MGNNRAIMISLIEIGLKISYIVVFLNRKC